MEFFGRVFFQKMASKELKLIGIIKSFKNLYKNFSIMELLLQFVAKTTKLMF